MSLVPPAVKTKNDNAAPKAVVPPGAKAEKAPKVAKPPKVVDPNAPKKERAPKNDYGYSKKSTIHVVADKEHKFRGQRLEWFDRVKQYDGKTCEEFSEAFKDIPNNKGVLYAPSGWIRFYVREGFVTLTRPAAE